MRHLRPSRILALLLLAACNSGTTVVEVEVGSINVSPASAALEVGLTLQFTAEVLDDSGSPLTGRTVTWESSVPGVASIDSDGLATGLTEGTTTITATVDGVNGSRSLTVSAASCSTVTDVTLSPGEFASFPGDECLLLPAGSAGDTYRVALARPTLIPIESNVPDVTLYMDPVAMAAAPPAGEGPRAASVPATVLRRDPGVGTIDMSRSLRHLEWQDATRAFHNELRLRERNLRFGPDAVLPRTPPGLAGAPPALVDPPATDSMFLQLDCSDTTAWKHVTLIAFSNTLAVYQETAERDTAAISTQAAQELIDYHDAYVRDMVQQYWGSIPDTDANGRVNVVTTPNLGENVAAAVYSGDYIQRNAGCPSSNEGETVYFNGPLMADLAPSTGEADYYALGTIAHEMKHVVSLYNGIQRPTGFNDIWVEEGTAEVSQEMSSRYAWAANGGPAVGDQITAFQLYQAATGGLLDREITGVIDVLAGTVRSLASQPNSVITDPDGAAEGHSFYSTGWHWHRWLGDAFGGASEAMDSAFFRELTDPNTPAGGTTGEIQLTGEGSFEQLFEDFVVAVSLHGTGYTAPYPIDTWDFVGAANIFSNPDPPGDYPWPVTATESGSGATETKQQWAPFGTATYSSPIGPSGVRFHDFRSSGTNDVQIHASANLAQQCDGAADRCDRIIVSRID
ncbi:MAG: Ig-like domain-containing protein [Gemmatimonadota bacterium]|jgi:hypothetical protein